MSANNPLSGFVVHPIDPGVRVRVAGSMPDLPPAIDALVETLWQAAIARVEAGGAGRLFNGRVFSADRIDRGEIVGHLTEFRRIAALMDEPGLGEALPIRPLAVCGVLRCADGIAIGRRPTGAVYQPGMWQLPPAGSVDSGAVRADGTVDLVAALREELREELGLPPGCLSGVPRPLCAVEHPGSRVTDLGIAIETALTGEQVLAAHAASGNREYDPLRIVAFADLPGFLEGLGDALVPPAREFLFRAGLLGAGISRA